MLGDKSRVWLGGKFLHLALFQTYIKSLCVPNIEFTPVQMCWTKPFLSEGRIIIGIVQKEQLSSGEEEEAEMWESHFFGAGTQKLAGWKAVGIVYFRNSYMQPHHKYFGIDKVIVIAAVYHSVLEI